MNIRKATIKDCDEIIELENLFVSPFLEKDVLYELKGNPVSKVYVICENDKILGFIDFWITFDSATICQIAIRKEEQNKGLATQLLTFSFDILKKHNVLFYTLEVRESNLSAISLYTKLGFEKICVKPKYYKNGENAIYMMKGLV